MDRFLKVTSVVPATPRQVGRVRCWNPPEGQRAPRRRGLSSNGTTHQPAKAEEQRRGDRSRWVLGLQRPLGNPLKKTAQAREKKEKTQICAEHL